MAPTQQQSGQAGWRDLRNGAILQCVEAATLGMPFEVWKTRMGRYRSETTVQAFTNVYRSKGGGLAGILAFYQGLGPKLVESASKGAVLLYSKELIEQASRSAGFGPTMSAFLAGAGGGVCQVSVMGPCTFLVTAAVTSSGSNKSTMTQLKETMAAKGVRGLYPGGSALAFRQATNWASRVGFTEAIRQRLKKNTKDGKLTITQEATAGIIGGAISCWNHPFEVARIEMQARGAHGQAQLSMLQVFNLVVKEHGPAGLFKGVLPRIGLGVWQTLFMVSGANLVKDMLSKK